MTDVSLNPVIIPSSDIQRSLAFYHSRGLSFVAERHSNGPEHFAAEIGGTVFEIDLRQAVEGNADPARIGFRVACVRLQREING